MKKSKAIIIVVGAVVAIMSVVLFATKYHQRKGEDLDSTSSSVDVSTFTSQDVTKPKQAVVEIYNSQKELIKYIANFILQYPLKSDEQMTVAKFNNNKIYIFVKSKSQSNDDVMVNVDENVMSKFEQFFAQEDFYSVYSNYGNDFVFFGVKDNGMSDFNAIILTRGKDVTIDTIKSNEGFSELHKLEPIDENVFYLETE